MDNLLVTKDTLKEEFQRRVSNGGASIEPVGLTAPVIGGRISKANDDAVYKAAMAASPIGYQPVFRAVGKYGSAFDIPRKWNDGTTMSVRDRIARGKLKLPREPQASTNTLMPDWENLWEAVRLDLSVRKAAMPSIRQFIYRELQRPNASRTMNISELFPYGVVFEENNGEGQSVAQGETRGGQYDSVDIKIYAAGFTWSLLAELFDNSLDMGQLNDAVAVGFNARRDDLAIDPILNFSYAGAGQTAAATLSGANRQELLYLTLEDAIDDLGERTEPITGRKIDVSNCVVLASELDARHIARVAQGLPSTNERAYPSLSEINRVLGYHGETIPLRDRTVTYSGVPNGTAYLIVPNRYMAIPIKRNMMVEVDMQPDVRTLSREERAYWFAEGIYTEGIQYFVQEITLPTW